MPGTMSRLFSGGLITLALASVHLSGSSASRSLFQGGSTPVSSPCAAATPGATPASTPTAGNAADFPFDLVFIDAMVFNHQATVAMAEIARQSSERPEILGMADAIITTQAADLTQLRAWRAAWFPDADPVPANVVAGLGDEGLMTSGALGVSGETSMADDTAGAMARLCAPDGPFDLAFLTEIIPIFQRALGMARLAIDRADQPELAALAQEIVTVQEAEVGQMITWLAEWYPQGPSGPTDGTPSS